MTEDEYWQGLYAQKTINKGSLSHEGAFICVCDNGTMWVIPDPADMSPQVRKLTFNLIIRFGDRYTVSQF